MGSKTVLEEMQDSFKNPVKKVEKVEESNGSFVTGLIILLIVSLVFGVAIVAKKAADWGAEHQIVKQSMVAQSFKAQLPYRIEKIEPTVLVSPLVEKIDQEDFTPVEQKICKVWGDYECGVALAVAKAEGLGHPIDAFNTNTNGTIDVGYFRINSVHFGQEGCSLSEVITEEGNINCAYILWEEFGWGAWSAFNNGSFVKNLID